MPALALGNHRGLPYGGIRSLTTGFCKNMAKNSGKAPGPSAIRSLNRPKELTVRTAEGSRRRSGAGVHEQGSEFFARKPISLRLHGRWFEVESVEDIWRIDDEWWREEAVSRMYYRCAVDGGMSVTVFHDLINGKWYRQSQG